MFRRAALAAALAVVCGTALTACFTSPPQIISLSPPRGSLGVAADVPVVVQFDRAVVPASFAGRVSVSPPIPGCDLSRAFIAPLTTGCRAVWVGGNTAFVIQHPRATFRAGHQYTFTVLGGFTSPDGVVNTVDHRWQITAGSAPEVRGINPADGSRNVPVDAPIAVSFSSEMEAATTAAAITLEPVVAGTRVLRSTLDHSRFVLFPGHLLEPGTKYRLTVSSGATDAHHQPLLAGVTSAFTTGALSTGGHAVVLVKRIGEQPTQVLITGLTPVESGVPVAAPIALEAPRCKNIGGCGDAPDGAPLVTYSAAHLAPGGEWLAVVERDATAIGAAPVLVVIDTTTGLPTNTFVGADLPAWSPDGTLLAFASGRDVSVYEPAARSLIQLPSGDPLLAAPVWVPGGELLALPVGPDPLHPHVDLADALVQARFPLPGIDGLAAGPVISPDGSQLAVQRLGPLTNGTWLVGVAGSTATPRRLDAALSPVGYSADGTLLANAATSAGPHVLVLVNVDSGDRIPLAHLPLADSLATVVLSSTLRRFAFVGAGSAGADEAFIENADGSASIALTTFGHSGLAAAAVTLSG